MKSKAEQLALDAAWEKILKRHEAPLERGAKARKIKVAAVKRSKIPKLEIPADRQVVVNSVDSGGGSTAAPPSQQYTGDKMIGIAVMHKSCLQPIFNEEAAVDAAKMRR